jgi:disulfide oxidoreductase YuzD
MNIKTKSKIITMRYEKETIDTLKSIARKKSYDQNKEIKYTDIIRDAVNKIINNEKP